LAEVYKSAMQVQSEKAEIFQTGKRNITNWKMIDYLGNAKIALPHLFYAYRFSITNTFDVAHNTVLADLG
jgi:hypothetical protein